MVVWLTNCSRSDIVSYITQMTGVKVVIGPPKATKEYTTDFLVRQNMVGLYRSS